MGARSRDERKREVAAGGVRQLRGPGVQLRSTTLADRRAVWDWLACSDLTASMMGPPEFAENPVPTWEEFCEDYKPFFFDDSRHEGGRSFIIERTDTGDAVGHISYDCHGERPHFAELDIWMRDSSCCGQGFGSEALRLLSDHLHRALGVREMILRPSARNVRAIRSYENAGFVRLDLTQKEMAARYGPGEYRETVVMRRLLDERARKGTGKSP
jgi:diamine N-acetyltransferase